MTSDKFLQCHNHNFVPSVFSDTGKKQYLRQILLSIICCVLTLAIRINNKASRAKLGVSKFFFRYKDKLNLYHAPLHSTFDYAIVLTFWS